MTTNLTIKAGHDIRYLTAGDAHGGDAGAMAYYTDSGEPPGRWAGKGAAALGLHGLVDAGVIEQLFMLGVGPEGQQLLRQRLTQDEDKVVAAFVVKHPFASATEIAVVRARARGGGGTRVPYYDVTVSASKSVSVLHASLKIAAKEARDSGDEVTAAGLDAEADGIEAALEASARFAVEQLEAEACYTRTGHHSATTGEWRDGGGLVAATFVHHISRDGDPQLHVHIAVANMVQRADGADEKVRALDGRALINQRLSVAAQTDRDMEARLIARGYAMVAREDQNGAEVAGVPQQVMDLFSSRHAALTPQVEAMAAAYEAKYGHAPSMRTLWLMGQQAAARTRRPKAQARRIHGDGDDADEAERLEAWEAQTRVREVAALSGVHKQVRAWQGQPVPVIDEVMLEMAGRAAVAEVQQHHSVWSLSELRFEVARALPPGAAGEQVRAAADLAVLPGNDVLLVTAPEVTDVSALGTRRDGTSIYRPPNEARYTTLGQVDAEDRIVRQAQAAVPQRVTGDAAVRVLAGSGLTGEQARAVVRLLTASTRVSVLTAPAGAGKTRAVAEFARAWITLTGSRVIGITTAENAARQMAEEGLAEVYNSAAFLGKSRDGGLRHPVALEAGDVLVLDEAGMLSTSDLALLLDYAERSGALVIPVGDPCQLGPVEAGGMLSALIGVLGAAELSEVLRFRSEWERDASVRLRAGEKDVTAVYDRHGRICAADREAALARAAQAWLADHLHGKDSLLLAGTNEEAADLARRVQADLIRLGTVVHPRAPMADGNYAGTGDLIRARLNSTIDAGGQRLANRDVLRITGWRGQDAEVRRRLPGGEWSEPFTIPAEYLSADAELHYAGNFHVAQGRTVDTSHVVVSDSLSRRGLYVGLTRGREANIAHVITGETAPEGAEPYQQLPAEAVLHAVMDREDEALSASEQIRLSQEWASGTGHLLNLWSAAMRQELAPAIEAELEQALGAAYARIGHEPQRHVLHDALRGQVLAGRDLRQVIRQVTAAPLDGARSVSAVLHKRVADLAAPSEPLSWAARTPESSGEIAQAAAAALDERRAELGERLAGAPEPWLLRHLGPPPREARPGLQAMLMAEYSRRAGIAAAYREAAGITDPQQAIRWEGHKGSPELEAMRRDTVRMLEIRSEEYDLAQMSRGELQARVLAGVRVQAAAPRDVSAELRAAELARQDMRAAGVQAQVHGEDPAAYQAAEAELEQDAEVLTGQDAGYQAWSESTAAERGLAGKAQAELTRRGGHEATGPENTEPEITEPEAPEVEAEAEAEVQAEAEPAVP